MRTSHLLILVAVLSLATACRRPPEACPRCPSCPSVESAPMAAAAADGKPENNPEETVPETSSLYHLVDQYEAVTFDHSGHEDYAEGCETCHHHASRVEHTPPCRECHGETSGDLRKPGLKGAYHRQCMNCHREMGEGPMGCEDCHRKRAGAAKPDQEQLALAAVPDRMRLGHLAQEYAGVDFAHKLHVELTDDCGTCHHHSKGVEVAPPCRECHNTPQELKNAYHEQCLGCHQSSCQQRQERLQKLRHERIDATSKDNEKKARAYGTKLERLMDQGGSPLNCRDCHAPRVAPKSVSLNHIKATHGPVDFDHEMHIGTAKFCTDCHHSHTGYGPFKSCRSCHGPDKEAAEDVGLEDAYHEQCKGCHEKDDQGPTDCGDCHQD